MLRGSRKFEKWLGPLAVFALLSACDANSTSGGKGGIGGASGGPNAAGGMAATDAPWWTLPSQSHYFERGGRRAPLFLRNATAGSAADFAPLLSAAHEAGADAIRIQLTQGFGYDTLGIDSQGNVLSAWAAEWDRVLDQAAAQGLSVIPVFAIWGDWNDGTPAAGWIHFDANPLNNKNGGPASSPAELFDDTATQRAWLHWLGTLIDRWQSRPNIIAWEVFSELDLATGANETNATAFAERASDLIRAHDPSNRPVLASTSDLPLLDEAPWTELWASRANDVVSLHPYDANLDVALSTRVAQVRAQTDKPILIGESGLDAGAPDGTTLTTSASAKLGLGQAIAAELVSGSASARAFYWEDGYATYYPQSGPAFVESMGDLEAPAAAWIHDLNFVGLEPATITTTPPIFGAALASSSEILGFIRASELTAPEWTATPVVNEFVQITLPAGSRANANWWVELQTLDGILVHGLTVTSTGDALGFGLQHPFTSLVFRARAMP